MFIPQVLKQVSASDSYVYKYSYIQVLDGKIQNSSLLYRCNLYLFILIKKSIFSLSKGYSSLFLYKQITSWYILLKQVGVISSLAKFGYKGALNSSSNESSLSSSTEVSFAI